MKGILCILPIIYWNRWSPLARLGIRYSLWGGLLPTKPHRRSIQIGVWWLQQYESCNNSHLPLFSLKCLCVANARYDKQSPGFDFLTLTNYIGLSIFVSSHLLDRQFSLHQSSSLHGSIRRLIHHQWASSLWPPPVRGLDFVTPQPGLPEEKRPVPVFRTLLITPIEILKWTSFSVLNSFYLQTT